MFRELIEGNVAAYNSRLREHLSHRALLREILKTEKSAMKDNKYTIEDFPRVGYLPYHEQTKSPYEKIKLGSEPNKPTEHEQICNLLEAILAELVEISSKTHNER